jgi:hypothetical protein
MESYNNKIRIQIGSKHICEHQTYLVIHFTSQMSSQAINSGQFVFNVNKKNNMFPDLPCKIILSVCNDGRTIFKNWMHFFVVLSFFCSFIGV